MTLSLLLLALGAAALWPGAAQAAPAWQYITSGATSPPPGRVGAAVVALPDGSSLIIGGRSGDPLEPSSRVVERLFPGQTQSELGTDQPLNVGRQGHTATLLPDGRVLVVGGLDSGGQPLASIEVGTITLSAAPGTPSIAWELRADPGEALGEARAFHTATVLPSGKVLVVGGQGLTTELASVESFDPFAKNGEGKWNGVAPLPAGQGRARHTATLLRDGRVLVAGGVHDGGADSNAWVLDPKAPSGNPWKPDQLVPSPTQLVMKSPRAGHHAVLMPSGQVLLVGGCDAVPQDTACKRPGHEDLFTPGADTGTWETFPAAPTSVSPPGGTIFGQSVVGLRNGWVLAVFGRTITGGPTLTEQREAFFLHPKTTGDDPLGPIQEPLTGAPPASNPWQWSSAPEPNQVPFHSFASISLDALGSVVVAGGLEKDKLFKNVAYLRYLPDGDPCSPAAPLDCAGGACLEGKCATVRLDGVLCDSAAQCASRHCEQGPGAGPSFCCAIECPDACTDDQTSLRVGTCGATCGAANVYCDGFLCKNKACQTTCTAPDDCAKGFFCQGGVCVGNRPDGAPCEKGTECASGSCADGVCCESACTTACEGCRQELTGDKDGLCRPRSPGQPARAGTCVASDDQPCGNDGTCDGLGACSLAPAQTPCDTGTFCPTDTQVSVRACDGAGVCGPAQVTTCLPYICDPDGPGCRFSCDPDQSDASGRNPSCGPRSFCSPSSKQCVAGTVCLGEDAYRDTSGQADDTIPCRPNQLCRADNPPACAAECSSSLDCKPGFVCRADGSCTAPATPSADDPDCYCAQPGRRPAASGLPALVAGLAAALGLSRRRRAASS